MWGGAAVGGGGWRRPPPPPPLGPFLPTSIVGATIGIESTIMIFSILAGTICRRKNNRAKAAAWVTTESKKFSARTSYIVWLAPERGGMNWSGNLSLSNLMTVACSAADEAGCPALACAGLARLSISGVDIIRIV